MSAGAAEKLASSAQTAFSPERAFRITTSINPETPEVKSMERQVEAGRPMPLYELAQGLVDYGKDYDPPPRIFIVYADGRRVAYAGEAVDTKNVQALEFVNSGPGLKPDYLQAILHGGGEETLGEHGRGMKIALTYLTKEGMPVEVESHMPERGAWKSKTEMQPTTTGVTRVLGAQGEWQKGESKQTVFRILNPNEKLLKLFNVFPESFLPANPNYAHAVIVEKKPDVRESPMEFTLTEDNTSSTVRCLKGVVPFSTENATNVWVDGLKVAYSSSERFKYPWAIENFRKRRWPLNIARSHDSEKVSGGIAEVAVWLALCHNTNPDIYRELIDVAVAGEKDVPRLPLELKDIASLIPTQLAGMDTRSKKLLGKLWKEKFGDACIARSAEEAARLARKTGGRSQAKVVRGAMHRWLAEAGVPLVEGVLGIEKLEVIDSGQPIRVEYVNDADALEKLFMEAGQFLADVKLLETGGEKSLMIRFPYAVESDGDFYERTKPGAQWLRVASVIAKRHDLRIEIKSFRQNRANALEFEITQLFYQRDKNEFGTTLKVSISRTQELAKAPNGYTMVTLTGAALNEMEPPPSRAAALEQLAQKTARQTQQEQEERMASLPVRKKQQKADEKTGEASQPPGVDEVVGDRAMQLLRTRVSRRALLGGGLALAGAGAVALYFKRLDTQGREQMLAAAETDEALDLRVGELQRPREDTVPVVTAESEAIGSPSSPTGVYELDFRSGKTKDPSIVLERKNPAETSSGYHRQFIGTRFIKDLRSGRGKWINTETYETVAVPQREPSQYTGRTRVKLLVGQRRLLMKSGEIVLGVEKKRGSPVEVLRERRGGNYILKGFIDAEEEAIIYTGPDRTAASTAVPIEEETAQMLDFKGLDADWQFLLGSLRADKKLSNTQKAAAVLEKWGKEYTYTDDPTADVQAKAGSAEVIATQMVQFKTGMCNNAATGAVGLLRMAEVPARVVVGLVIDDFGETNLHMWTEYWNGAKWEEVEPLRGSKKDPKTGTRRSQYLDTVERQRPAQTTEQILKEQRRLIEEMHRRIAYRKKQEKQEQSASVGVQKTPDRAKQDRSLIKKYGPFGVGVGVGIVLKSLVDRLRGKAKDGEEEIAEEKKQE